MTTKRATPPTEQEQMAEQVLRQSPALAGLSDEDCALYMRRLRWHVETLTMLARRRGLRGYLFTVYLGKNFALTGQGEIAADWGLREEERSG